MSLVIEKEDVVNVSLITGRCNSFRAVSSRPRGSDPTIVRSTVSSQKTDLKKSPLPRRLCRNSGNAMVVILNEVKNLRDPSPCSG
jgi:hypothetical protein